MCYNGRSLTTGGRAEQLPMTLHPIGQWTIPPDTRKVAEAAFPKGNVYMKMSSILGQLYSDEDFCDLYRARCGKEAISPARLALVTVMQFAEGLSDRQAADAVRSRIDWKYALGLELTDPGFDYTVLKDFRERLLSASKEVQLLDLMLEKIKSQKLLKKRGIQRSDSTHVLAAVRKLNRIELVGEAMRHTLNELANKYEKWLLSIVIQDWYGRYEKRFEQCRLPQDKSEQEQLALTIGIDGHYLLAAIYSEQAPSEIRKLPCVEIMRQIWLQQYTFISGELVWRTASDKIGLPAHGKLIQSPFDIEARNRTKRQTNWTGYTVHLTETCSKDYPNIITNVETTAANVSDGDITQKINSSLASKKILPSEHLVDMAYIDAENIATSSSDYQVDLVGKVPPDRSWQAKTSGAFDINSFAIDWELKRVKCPMGEWSKAWRDRKDEYGNSVIEVRFERKTCGVCAQRTNCTKAQKEPRLLKLRQRDAHEALQSARKSQKTEEFTSKYAQRAGIEGTISQAVRAYDMRRSRYRGLSKTYLQHIATAVAINLSRLMNWWSDVPKAKTRVSAFAARRKCSLININFH